MRRLFAKLFPSLAHLEPVELMLLPFAILWLIGGIAGLAETALYELGYYDSQLTWTGTDHTSSDGWEP